MSDTPRTDALMEKHGEYCQFPCHCKPVADFARQLERELAVAKKQCWDTETLLYATQKDLALMESTLKNREETIEAMAQALEAALGRADHAEYRLAELRHAAPQGQETGSSKGQGKAPAVAAPRLVEREMRTNYMSDTPRTDAEIECFCEAACIAMVGADFARQLERELNALKNPPCQHTELQGWVQCGQEGTTSEAWCKRCGQKF